MGSSCNLWLAFFFLALCLEGSKAQSGCTSVLIGMSSCLNYVTGSSKNPSASCCSSLASVVKSQPQCLCTALDGTTLSALGFNINKTIALALPSTCKVKTPPVSRCNGGNKAPVMAPITSMDESSNGPSPTSTFIAGSKQVVENGGTSDVGGDKKMRYLVLSGLVAGVVMFT